MTTIQLSYCILDFFSLFFVTNCYKTVTKKVQLFGGANQFVIFCYVRKHLITGDFLSNSCKLCGKSIPEKTLDSPTDSVLEKAVLCTSPISKSEYCLFFKQFSTPQNPKTAVETPICGVLHCSIRHGDTWQTQKTVKLAIQTPLAGDRLSFWGVSGGQKTPLPKKQATMPVSYTFCGHSRMSCEVIPTWHAKIPI